MVFSYKTFFSSEMGKLPKQMLLMFYTHLACMPKMVNALIIDEMHYLRAKMDILQSRLAKRHSGLAKEIKELLMYHQLQQFSLWAFHYFPTLTRFHCMLPSADESHHPVQT